MFWLLQKWTLWAWHQSHRRSVLEDISIHTFIRLCAILFRERIAIQWAKECTYVFSICLGFIVLIDIVCAFYLARHLDIFDIVFLRYFHYSSTLSCMIVVIKDTPH